MNIKNLIAKFEKIFDLCEKNSNRYFIFFIFFILLLALLVRFDWMTQKNGLHMDEALSVMFANYTPTNVILDYGYRYKGSQLKKIVSFDNQNFSDAFDDIKNLYFDSRDLPHTNFYYSLLRLSFAGRKSADLNDIICTGVFLNCLFFIIEYIFLFKSITLLFEKNRFITLVSLFCISLAGGSISATLFLRPYQLQIAMFIVFFYALLNTVINKKYTLNNFLFIIIITAFTFLSGYFSIIFIGLNLIFFSAYLFFTKNIKKLYYLFFSLTAGGILAQCLYAKYWQTIFFGKDRAGEAYSKLDFNYVINNVATISDAFFNFLSTYALYPLSLSLIFISIFTIIIHNKITKTKTNFKLTPPP